MAVDSVTARLVEMQKMHEWSDRIMAEKLGVSRSYWIRLRTGTRSPGRKVLVGVFRSFPELEGWAVEQLRRM